LNARWAALLLLGLLGCFDSSDVEPRAAADAGTLSACPQLFDPPRGLVITSSCGPSCSGNVSQAGCAVRIETGDVHSPCWLGPLDGTLDADGATRFALSPVVGSCAPSAPRSLDTRCRLEPAGPICPLSAELR
jgi:hypothetical protein